MRPVSLTLAEPRDQAALAQEPFHTWYAPDGSPWTGFFRLGADYLLRFPGIADFVVGRDGIGVRAHPAPGADPQTVAHMFQNQVHPLAQSLQGQLVLHGSVVDLGRWAVGFVGATGRGKSTLAASFARAGFPFLGDDALHIEWVDARPRVRPGHPSVRLWADSEQALVPEGARPEPALAFTTKSRFLAGPEFPFGREPLPLLRLYFLGPGDVPAPVFEPLRPAAVVAEMVKHSFLLDVSGQASLTWHFDELSRLAGLGIHYALDYPRSYDQLPRVRDAIVRHVGPLPTMP